MNGDTLTAKDLMAAAKKLRENCYPPAPYYFITDDEELAALVVRLFPGTQIIKPTPVEQRVSIEQIVKGQGR